MLTTTPYHAPICERAKSAGSWHVDHLLKVFVESIKKRRHSLLLAQGRNPFNPTNYGLFFVDQKYSFHVVPTAGRLHSSPFPKPHRRVLYDTRAARWSREGVGGVWLSSLELTETVTIFTPNHFHLRLSFVRGFHLRNSLFLTKLYPVVAWYTCWPHFGIFATLWKQNIKCPGGR